MRLRSSLIAAGQDGAFVSPSQWNAGDYRGTSYEAFSNIMFPGTAKSQVFSVKNASNTSPMTANLSSRYLVKISETITTVTTLPVSQESAYSFRKPDYLWRVDPMIPAGADLMEINVYSPYGEFSLGDPTNGSTQKARGDNAWYSRLYDWSDLNHNGTLWTDKNGNTLVDPGELDEPGIDPLTGEALPDTSSEINQLNEGNNSANTLQIRVQKPLQRMHSGLFLGLTHRVRSSLQPVTHLQIKYTYYRSLPWPWLTVTTPSLVLPPGGSASFTATMAVPADTKLGLYQGSIVVNRTGAAQGTETIVPVVVNVAANGTGFTFSDPNGSTQIFDNSRVYGGYDWRGNGWYPQGDWRTFFLDVPDAAPLPTNSSFLVQASWVYTPTDIDILAFGPTPHYAGIPITSSIVGPYNMGQTGTSPQTVHSTGTGSAYTFKTSSGGAKELITAQLKPGLNQFLLHNVLYNGPAGGEPYTVTVGTAAVNPATVVMTTTESHVDIPMTFSASLDLPDGLQGMGFGMSAPMFYNDQYVAPATYNYYTFTVKTAGLLTLRTAPAGAAGSYDVDLYLDRLQGSTWTPVGSSGGPDANEYIQVQLPADGTYRARVLGYTVPGPAYKYNLSIDLRQGSGVTVTGLPSGFIAAGTVVSFTASIDTSGLGLRNGVVYVGPAGSPTAFAIPIMIDRSANHVFLPMVINNYPPLR